MGYAELIEKLRALPRDKQAEVFDFVEFLAAKFAATPEGSAVSDREFGLFSLTQAMRGMEDEPVLYSVDDLVERWQ